VRRAFLVRPWHSLSTRELLAWSHPRLARARLRERRNACRAVRRVAAKLAVPARPKGHTVRTARSWRGILPFAHLGREGRMTATIGRRELLAALGGAAIWWPLAERAAASEVKGGRQ